MREVKPTKTYREKAKAAASKPAALGQDIELDSYLSSADEPPYRADPSQLPAEAKHQMLAAGV